MKIAGKITDYNGQYLTITAPFSDTFSFCKKNIRDCEIRLNDGRHISSDQRKKIYATMRDISLYTGYMPDEAKEIMKYSFIAKTGCGCFSLSDCDMTTANRFLTFLIDFCLDYDIPCEDSLLDRSPDVAGYLYSCLVRKKCCITGSKAELHHVDAVGSRGNRKEIVHTGMRVLPLTRKLHTEAHNLGRDTFCQKYHVFGIVLDRELCKIWNVKSEKE